jgi:hypothetical protein
MSDVPALSLFTDQPMPIEDIDAGGAMWQRPQRMARVKDREDLLGAPSGVALAYFNDRADDVRWCLAWRMARPPGLLL